jgi:hypothetical protein
MSAAASPVPLMLPSNGNVIPNAALNCINNRVKFHVVTQPLSPHECKLSHGSSGRKSRTYLAVTFLDRSGRKIVPVGTQSVVGDGAHNGFGDICLTQDESPFIHLSSRIEDRFATGTHLNDTQ